PGNVKVVQYGQPAIDFTQEIMFTKGEAEVRAQSPDTSIEKPGGGSGRDKRTAKEVGIASSISQVGQNHSGSIFKGCLAKLLAFDWGLCLQYKRKKMTYFVSDDLKTLPEQALHDEYMVTAGGSTDDWDKQLKLNKALGRLQELKGAPNVNQDELVRDVLAADDARLVNRLLIPQQQKAASEAEDETQEITSMMVTHFAAPVKPAEDHVTRIKTLLQFLQAQGVKGVPLDPLAKQRLHEHLMQHMQLLKKLQPQAFKQLVMQIRQSEQQPVRPPPQAMAPRGAPMTMPRKRLAAGPMRML